LNQVLGIARLCCLEPCQFDAEFIYSRVLLGVLGREVVNVRRLQPELGTE
jgi:hypothetical protein